jgi:hypothetical protein
MGLLSCRRCAGICCGDGLVERFDGGVDVFALEDERRKEAKNRVASAIDNDATLYESTGDLLR